MIGRFTGTIEEAGRPSVPLVIGENSIDGLYLAPNQIVEGNADLRHRRISKPASISKLVLNRKDIVVGERAFFEQ